MRLLYRLLDKIVFMVNKTIIMLFYISCFFTLVVVGKEYFAKLNQKSEPKPEPHVFGPSGAGAT